MPRDFVATGPGLLVGGGTALGTVAGRSSSLRRPVGHARDWSCCGNNDQAWLVCSQGQGAVRPTPQIVMPEADARHFRPVAYEESSLFWCGEDWRLPRPGMASHLRRCGLVGGASLLLNAG